MQVIFKTNLDAYQHVRWPEMNCIPPVGTCIQPGKVYTDHLASQKLPVRLEVVSVTVKEVEVEPSIADRIDEAEMESLGIEVIPKRTVKTTIAEVDLWYNKTDYDLYTLSGHKLL